MEVFSIHLQEPCIILVLTILYCTFQDSLSDNILGPVLISIISSIAIGSRALEMYVYVLANICRYCLIYLLHGRNR